MDDRILGIGKIVGPKDLRTPSPAEVWGMLRVEESQEGDESPSAALGRVIEEANALLLLLADDSGVSEKVSAGEVSTSLAATLAGMDSLGRRLDGALDSARSQLVQKLVRERLGSHGRSLKRWLRRWREDAPEAEEAYRRVAWKARTDHSYREFAGKYPGSYLTDQDLAVAELYYYALMNQRDVGGLIGLSQPAIAARLTKIDQIVAEELLRSRLIHVALGEGWDVLTDFSYSGRNLHASFDLLVRNEESTEVGVKLAVLPPQVSVDRGMDWLDETSEAVVNIAQVIVPALAVYDTRQKKACLFTSSDVDRAVHLLPAREQGADTPVSFTDFRALVGTDLSIRSLLKRENDGDSRDPE